MKEGISTEIEKRRLMAFLLDIKRTKDKEDPKRRSKSSAMTCAYNLVESRLASSCSETPLLRTITLKTKSTPTSSKDPFILLIISSIILQARLLLFSFGQVSILGVRRFEDGNYIFLLCLWLALFLLTRLVPCE